MVNYIGYKAFDENLQCRGFQYEVGGRYEMEESPLVCYRGFHFCEQLRNVFEYKDCNSRICIVKSFGEVQKIGGYPDYMYKIGQKTCTNKIEILKEIELSKIDRIKYVYANSKFLSPDELNLLLSTEISFEGLLSYAERGYVMRLINDIEIKCQMAKLGECLDILVDDDEPLVRLEVAKQGYGLEKLIHDQDWNVREEAISQKN